MSTDYKLLLISEDHSQAEEIYSRVSRIFPDHSHMQMNEVRREISRSQPDVVILHEMEDGDGYQTIPYIIKEVPDVIVIYVTERRDPIRTRDVHRSGVFDTLFLPEELGALENVANRALKALQTRGEDNRHTTHWGRGQIVSLYSGKGGCGRSLIASTLAQTLGLDAQANVLLVDLNLQYGGVDTYLDVESEQSIYDLTPVLNELNDNHIRSVTSTETYSQIDVMASPCNAEIAEQVTDEHVHRLLRAARIYYDFVVVDLPTEMTALTFAALEESDWIYYVMTPDSPSVRIFGHVLDLFAKLGSDPADRLQILVNRKSKDSELSENDIKQHFNYPVIGELREDAKRVPQSINRGIPLRTSAADRNLSALARDIRKLVRKRFGKKVERSAS